jgi:hypothetical protein
MTNLQKEQIKMVIKELEDSLKNDSLTVFNIGVNNVYSDDYKKKISTNFHIDFNILNVKK